ncbi:MAG: multidrug effflux MFS transporter [Pseudomonadota bacterium]
MTLPNETDRVAGNAPLGFLVFLALMTSVVALTIDAILPAMDAISDDLAFAKTSDRHLLVLLVFAGIGVGQLVFGPLADAIGRKRTAIIGWSIYIVGTVLAMTAGGIWGIMLGRVLQGFGAAGPRVVANAIVRDCYEGRAMARIISLIMTVFMLVPLLAPMIGQGLELLGGWRAIFALYLAMAMVCAGWYLADIPETLTEKNRRPLSVRPMALAFREVLSTRKTMLYTAGSASIFASFAAFLSAAQQIYEGIYGLGELFPLIFAATAASFAVAQYANSRLVMRVGMRPLCRIAALMVMVSATSVLVLSMIFFGPVPPFWAFFGGLFPIFIGSALMFSNLTALALDPLGHVAGTASAVVMSASMLTGVPIGMIAARQVDGTVLPILGSFAILGTMTLVFIVLADRSPDRREDM